MATETKAALLTEKEVAEMLAISKPTLRRNAKTPGHPLAALGVVRLGHLIRYRRADVERLISGTAA
jgi:predicted DNA-binding transcriptional regulator AlpA